MTKEEKIKDDLEFIPIVGYEELYELNKFGQVKSIQRISYQKNGKKYTVKEKIMKPQVDSTGYIVFGLRSNKATTKVYLHRIIAEAFIPNPENKLTVNHKNGVKHDNSISNLEWATYKENNIHAFETGLQKKGKEHHLYGKKGINCHNHKKYNRGWIKIESEADLPKSVNIMYRIGMFLNDGRFHQDANLCNHKTALEALAWNYTHYQPITESEPPIY